MSVVCVSRASRDKDAVRALVKGVERAKAQISQEAVADALQILGWLLWDLVELVMELPD